MTSLYAATVIGAVVTTVLAMRVLMVRAKRSVSRGWLARLLFDVDWLLRAARNCVDDWIAAVIADRERKALNSMQHEVDHGDACDAAADRGDIDDVCGCEPGSCRLADRSGGGAIDEIGR